MYLRFFFFIHAIFEQELIDLTLCIQRHTAIFEHCLLNSSSISNYICLLLMNWIITLYQLFLEYLRLLFEVFYQ